MKTNQTIKSKAVAISILVLGPYAMAQSTYYVDNDATGPIHDGSSWCQAFQCLQDALAAAQPLDIIRVAEGTYRPDCGAQTPGDRSATFAIPSGIEVRGGYAGCGATNPDSRNPTSTPSILSGDLSANDNASDFPNGSSYAENSLHIVTTSGTSSSTLLDGFTITGGNANGIPEDDAGAAVYSVNGSAIISRCVFSGNSAGRGAAVHTTGGSLTLRDNFFYANAASSWGGALDNFSGSTIVINCVMVGNTAVGEGGAIHSDLATVTITNSTICNNEAGNRGGGVFNYAGAEATITNSVIWNNNDIDGVIEFAQIFNNKSNIVNINHSCVTAWSGSFGGANNMGDNPNFLDSPSPGPDGTWNGIDDNYGNLRLAMSSPCHNTGDNTADVDALTPGIQPLPLEDIAGNTRISGGTVDIGAYELQSGGAVPATSTWGVVICAMLLTTIGTLITIRNSNEIKQSQSGDCG